MITHTETRRRYCCNCEYWAGQRTISRVKNSVEFDNSQVAQCHKEFNIKKKSIGNDQCMSFVKWAVLNSITFIVNSVASLLQ
jgi:hypothetical protein